MTSINWDVNCKSGDTVLGIVIKRKGLRSKISADRKVPEQCGIAALKDNQMFRLIMRNITCKKKVLIIHLHKAKVRPHLEYGIHVWRLYRNKDLDTLERKQRRATKIIPELRDLSYKEHLRECGLTNLETRRRDNTEVSKILNGY